MKHKANKSGTAASPSKGKSQGKGKERSAGTFSNEAIDFRDCPLRLPEFAEIDHSKVVPRYSAVLKRSEQDGVLMEDIDALQLELEALLSATVVRKMTLKEEVKVLNNIEKYKGQGRIVKKGPSSPGKRGLPGKDSKSGKKLKNNHGKPVELPSKVIGIPKLKTDSSAPSFDPLQNEQIRPISESSKPALPKNETPNRFWAFVEPYCVAITADDIKLVEDLIKTHEDMSDYFKVPKLGQHYSTRWAKEDLECERIKGSSDGADSSAGGASEPSSQVASMLKKAESSNHSEDSPFGELTQRLVAGLMEENIMFQMEDGLELSGGKSCSDVDPASDHSKNQLIKSLNIGNAEALEARVKSELEEQGIIDPSEDVGADNAEHDEILEELVRSQNELRAISQHNLSQLRRLLKVAKEEMARQELRQKLQQADEDVMEAFKKVLAARAKKKPPSKKEREMAWRALKERELILQHLESV